MRPLLVEFRPALARARRWPLLAAAALGLLSLGLFSVGQRLDSEREALQVSRAGLQAAQQAAREREAQSRLPRWSAGATAEARTAARLASFDWSGTLAAVESPRIEGVQLSSLEVSAADDQVRVEATGPDQGALLRYAEEINLGEAQRRWELLQLRAAEGSKPASLTLVRRRAEPSAVRYQRGGPSDATGSTR